MSLTLLLLSRNIIYLSSSDVVSIKVAFYAIKIISYYYRNINGFALIYLKDVNISVLG